MDAFEAIFGARIPKDWLKKSWESASLGSWFAVLLARHDQLAKWLLHGRPKSFWLTGFFNPQVSVWADRVLLASGLVTFFAGGGDDESMLAEPA